MTGGDELAVQVGQVPAYTRCGGTAPTPCVRFGHSWTNTAGHPGKGFREADLWPACDSGETRADDLLVFFAATEQLPLVGPAFGVLPVPSSPPLRG
ncbi:DUF6300 family protein [Streptomyces sp. H62]